MQLLKYHVLNIISVVMFSYIVAITINAVIEYNISPSFTFNRSRARLRYHRKVRKNWEEYSVILKKPFFKKKEEAPDVGQDAPPQKIGDLSLLGTITGPYSIARALIKKRTEKKPQIFRLWKDVYGYKLVRIRNNKVYLKLNEDVHVLDIYDKSSRDRRGRGRRHAPGARTSSRKRNISRSEIRQKALNNMDNALRGLRAGPYRVRGKIEGYKIFRIKPYNILYKLGARNGDIIKRINGHPVNSTAKLYRMWNSMKKDSKIVVNILRGGRNLNFEFNITN